MLRFEICLLIISTTICATYGASPNFDSPAVYQVTPPVDHAEGPTWDGRKNILYYVDIHTGSVLSYNYNTKGLNSIKLNGDVTPVIQSKNDENVLIVGLNRSLVAVEWDGEHEIKSQRVLTTVAKQFPGSRFNDGKADRNGRVWIGTMGPENTSTGELSPNEGIFYKITKDNLANPTIELAPVNISNGLAWNKANNIMYYIDTPTLKIIEFHFNNTNGTISNPRVAFDVKNETSIAGSPDGMTIDEDDNLWVALYGGGSIIKVNPKTGQLLQVIGLPARDVTSAMFGGPNLDILFVTTSRISLTNDEKKIYPSAGSVFGITNLHTKGRPVFNADIA